MNTTPENSANAFESLNAMIAILIKVRSLAVEGLTERQLAAAIVQAVQCGDFKRYVRVDTDGQQVVYEPFAEYETLKGDKASLDWLEKQQGLITCGFRFKWFNDSGITLREAIRREMEKEKVASVA